MEYMVIGADGKEYGPIDFSTLAQWAKDDRVRPNSMVKEFATGRTIQAAEVPGLFVPAASGPQSAPYFRPNTSAPMPQYTTPVQVNTGALVWAFVDSVLAVAMVFFFNGYGIVFAIFGIVNAFRAKAEGHRLAPVAIVCSFIATILVIVGWAMLGRFN